MIAVGQQPFLVDLGERALAQRVEAIFGALQWGAREESAEQQAVRIGGRNHTSQTHRVEGEHLHIHRGQREQFQILPGIEEDLGHRQ